MSNKSNAPEFFVLNWIRGICAILVVFGHARFFYPYENLSRDGNITNIEKILLLPTSLAVESVAIFFLISGFLVGGQVWRNVNLGIFSWKKFLVDRLTRFWVVLIPGLFFSQVLHNVVTKGENLVSVSNDSLKNMGCNLIFLMPTRCKPFAKNESLWSLGYEFYFYLIFALVISLIYRKNSVKSKILHIIWIQIVAVSFTPALFILILPWLLGFYIYIVFEKRKNKKITIKLSQRWIIAILLLACILLSSNIYVYSQTTTILFTALGASYVILLATYYSKHNISIFHGKMRLLNFLGKASFTIYVFHLPFIQFYYFMISNLFPAFDVIVVYFVAFLSCITSSLLYFVFEKHTFLIRNFVYRRLKIIV